MLKEFIHISYKTVTRSESFYKDLLAVFLLSLYVVLAYLTVAGKVRNILDSLFDGNPAYPLEFLLVSFPFILLSDLGCRFVFKKKTLCLPAYFQVLPVRKKMWDVYFLYRNIFHYLNFLPILLYLFFLGRYANASGNVLAIALLWLMGICNNAICCWAENLRLGWKFNVIALSCAIAWMALLYLFIFLWSLFGFTFVTYSFLALVLAAVTAGLFRQVLSVRKFYAGSNLGGRMGLGMSGGAVSFLKMELLYVIRSKRLRMLISLPHLPLLVLGYIQGNSEVFPYIYTTFPILLLGQCIFGIEANFINGIWTKPISLLRILEAKYYFYMCLTLLASLLVLPFVFMHHLNLLKVLVWIGYVVSVFNLAVFPVMFYTKRLDLNSSSMMNNQGGSFAAVVYEMTVFIVCYAVFSRTFKYVPGEWVAAAIISGISLLAFLLRKVVLQAVVSRFVRNRHAIMQRYINS